MAFRKVCDVTRARIPFWGFWGGALASVTAAILCLALQFGFLPSLAGPTPAWRNDADIAALDDMSAPAAEEPPAPLSRTYALYYADAGQALILYDRNLIVVHQGAPLPDGSRVSYLSPDRLVTTAGRTLHVR